jgi:hypothetical protein
MAKGDHIYGDLRFDGNLITHHGIDCGDGYVIEYDKETLDGIGQIVRKPLNSFLKGRAYQTKKHDICDSPEIVVARAYSRLGEKDYCVLFNNCEHFAYWCKTGSQESDQVNRVVHSITKTVVGVGTTTTKAVAAKAAVRQAMNPVAKGLVGIGLKQAPKLGMAGRVTAGAIGIGGVVTGAATDYAINQLLKDDVTLSEDERETRKTARIAGQVGSFAGGIGGLLLYLRWEELLQQQPALLLHQLFLD